MLDGIRWQLQHHHRAETLVRSRCWARATSVVVFVALYLLVFLQFALDIFTGLLQFYARCMPSTFDPTDVLLRRVVCLTTFRDVGQPSIDLRQIWTPPESSTSPPAAGFSHWISSAHQDYYYYS